MEIFGFFGIDWKLMVAQLVNFLIVAAVLWWFALKPLVQKMKQRNKNIEKGIQDARQAEEKLRQAEKKVGEMLKESKFDAQMIIGEAQKNAEQDRQQQLKKTKKEVAVVVAKAKEQITAEKEKMIGEAKKKMAEIVVRSLEKILADKLDKDIDSEYIRKIIEQLEK